MAYPGHRDYRHRLDLTGRRARSPAKFIPRRPQYAVGRAAKHEIGIPGGRPVDCHRHRKDWRETEEDRSTTGDRIQGIYVAAGAA